MSEIQKLMDRLASGERGLAIETEIEIALFQPCNAYASVTANAAATKLRYVRADGHVEVCWPQDWCNDPAETITLLRTVRILDDLTQRLNNEEFAA